MNSKALLACPPCHQLSRHISFQWPLPSVDLHLQSRHALGQWPFRTWWQRLGVGRHIVLCRHFLNFRVHVGILVTHSFWFSRDGWGRGWSLLPVHGPPIVCQAGSVGYIFIFSVELNESSWGKRPNIFSQQSLHSSRHMVGCSVNTGCSPEDTARVQPLLSGDLALASFQNAEARGPLLNLYNSLSSIAWVAS